MGGADADGLLSEVGQQRVALAQEVAEHAVDEAGGLLGGELGRLDGLLHCAADFPGLTPLDNTDPAAFARALHVNVTARWWLTQACLPLLRKAEDSAVVFAIDDPARSGGAFWGGYGLAQPAQAALVSMLQAELGEHGPRISGFLPGPMRTALRGRAYQPNGDAEARPASDHAAACVALLSAAGATQRGCIVDASWSP